MKIDESTVSVIFFLNKRRKPAIYNNETWHPVYARLHFQRNNTSLRVFDRHNRGLYATEKVFNDLMFFYEKKDYDKSHLEYGPGIILLENEKIIIKTLEHEWKSKKDKFNFKEYTKNLRIWQRDLRNVLTDFLLEEISKISKTHLDFNNFRRLEADVVISYDKEFSEWKRLIQDENINQELKDIAEVSIAYFQFIEDLFYFQLGNKTGVVRPATYRGTVFSWLDGIDKREFIDYVENAPDDHFNRYGNFVSKYFCKNFIEYFQVQSSKASGYSKVIQRYIDLLR